MTPTKEKIAYLKGLLSGLKIDGDQKLIIDAIVDVLDELAEDTLDLADAVMDLQEDMEDVIDGMDDLMDDLFDEAEDDDIEYDDDDENDDDDGYITFICPSCGRHILFDVDSFNADGEHKCSCGADLLFEEAGDLDDEE